MSFWTMAGRPGASAQIAAETARHGAVAAWLFVCCGLIFAMVVVGGITRLTLSGLSITQWNPVIGIVPPLTSAQWAAAFASYREIPEYRLIHYGMSLAEFKTIYFWEYAHRLLGRLIGIAYAVPLVWFWSRGRLPRRLLPGFMGILALGFCQGLLGWYMVESGLADRVEVSQYRLVAHLALALAIYSLILWTALGLVRSRTDRCPSPPFRGEREGPAPSQPSPACGGGQGRGWEGEVGASALAPVGPLHPVLCPRPAGGEEEDGSAAVWRRAAEGVILLIGLTIAAGGFVAGTRAGLIYNTFPLMGGTLAPAEYAQLHPFFRNWFENLAAIQFDHRLLAMTTFVAMLVLWFTGLRRPLPASARLALHTLLAAAAVQIVLGISTLLLVAPIPLAAAHQAGAVLLLTVAIVFRHTLRAPALIDAKAGVTI